MSETGIIIGNAIVWGIGLVELAFLAKVGITSLVNRHHAIEMSKRVMAREAAEAAAGTVDAKDAALA